MVLWFSGWVDVAPLECDQSAVVYSVYKAIETLFSKDKFP